MVINIVFIKQFRNTRFQNGDQTFKRPGFSSETGNVRIFNVPNLRFFVPGAPDSITFHANAPHVTHSKTVGYIVQNFNARTAIEHAANYCAVLQGDEAGTLG